jgi:hypothetical protein
MAKSPADAGSFRQGSALIAVSAEQIEAAKLRLHQRIAQAIRETDYHAEPGALAGYLSDLRALDHIAPAEAAQKETTA